MPPDTIETCPKHGLQFNRAHYFECEQCRGAHVTAGTLEVPLSPELITRLKAGAALLGGLLVIYIGVAIVRGNLADKEARAHMPAIVGLPCAQTCTQHADECFTDCASVREEQCTSDCLPQLQHCVDRCNPPVRVRDGIAVIMSGLADPEVDNVALGIYRHWPPDDLPERAYVRLSIDRTTGKVREALAQAAPGASAGLVATTFKQAVFPKAPPDPHADEPGRHDVLEPYVVYLLLKP